MILGGNTSEVSIITRTLETGHCVILADPDEKPS